MSQSMAGGEKVKEILEDYGGVVTVAVIGMMVIAGFFEILKYV